MSWNRSGSDDDNSMGSSSRSSSHSSSREPRDGITLADTEEDSYDNESDSTGSLVDFIVDEGEIEEEERRPKRRRVLRNSGKLLLKVLLLISTTCKFVIICFKGNSAINRTSATATATTNSRRQLVPHRLIYHSGSDDNNIDRENAVGNPRGRSIVYVDSEDDHVPPPIAEVVVKNEQTARSAEADDSDKVKTAVLMPVVVKQEGIKVRIQFTINFTTIQSIINFGAISIRRIAGQEKEDNCCIFKEGKEYEKEETRQRR